MTRPPHRRPRTESEPAAGRPARLSFLFDLFAANQRIKLLLSDAFAGCSLRSDEYAVYSTLVEFGPLTPTRMADTCGMPPTTIATYVKEMLARGHITRSLNDTDRRSSLLSLTAEGRQAHEEAGRAFSEVERRMLAELAPSEAEVRGVLRALEQAAAIARDDLERTAQRDVS